MTQDELIEELRQAVLVTFTIADRYGERYHVEWRGKGIRDLAYFIEHCRCDEDAMRPEGSRVTSARS